MSEAMIDQAHCAIGTDTAAPAVRMKQASGVPTGNAGEYFVMGEFLRRGYDAQLADHNTAGYDILVGQRTSADLRKAQVKTVRSQPWFVRQENFAGDLLDQVTVYVLIGDKKALKPIRYFIVRNRDVASKLAVPANWTKGTGSAFLSLKSIQDFENNWKIIGT